MKLKPVIAAGALAGACLGAFGAGAIRAQVPPTGVADQAALLASPDPALAANKKLVFDMWRAIIQAGHVEMAPQYFAPDYIQHNPNVASGRDNMVKFMSQTRPVKPIAPDITFPVVAMVAEGDLVVVATVTHAPDPADPSRKYATTHFDMFRIDKDHKIAEHWDNLPKDAALLHTDPNVSTKP